MIRYVDTPYGSVAATSDEPGPSSAEIAAHLDRVRRAGCPHDAVRFNGAPVLIDCPDCRTA